MYIEFVCVFVFLWKAILNFSVTIRTTVPEKTFKWFMITAEDPEVDNNVFEFSHKNIDVGTLKTLDINKSRYSERCSSSVENADNSYKSDVEVFIQKWSPSVRLQRKSDIIGGLNNLRKKPVTHATSLVLQTSTGV